MFIKDNSAWINIDIVCKLLMVTRSSYYDWLSNLDKYCEKEAKFNDLSRIVIESFYHYKSRLGASRLLIVLKARGINCSYRTIVEIMKKNKLFVNSHKRFKVTTTNSDHKHKVFDNLLERNFKVDRPNQVYVSDITYIRTLEGWLYLATVIDLYSRKVIGYKMSHRMTKELVVDALLVALKARGYPQNVIVHSDRSSQYASNEYKKILMIHNLKGSMSKKGDCWDNAVAESFFATLKKEYVHHTLFNSRIEGRLGIFDYIEAWYNNERPHSTLGYLSPNEFEELNKDKFSHFNKKMKNRNFTENSFFVESSR